MPGEIVALLLLATVVLGALVYFGERSARRASERARVRAAAEGRRTDYPLAYEWGPNIRTWGPSCRVVIHEDSFTSDLAGVRFAAPIASIWKVTRSAPEGIPRWRVLCHRDSPEPQGLEMFGGEMCEVAARVLAQKAGVDVEESA
jgi:hypothetical protein